MFTINRNPTTTLNEVEPKLYIQSEKIKFNLNCLFLDEKCKKNMVKKIGKHQIGRMRKVSSILIHWVVVACKI